MDFKLHLHEFFVEGGNREKSHVILHIAEPSTQAEMEKGYFFAVCEVNNTDTKYIVAMQNIIDDIENRYFEMPETKEENSFETVLQKINQDNFLLSNAQTDINCAVGIIKQQEIIFAYHGTPNLLLFYKTREDFYKKMDLIDVNAPVPAGKQLFPQIVQGKIGLHDFMFIGTPRVAEVFSADRLQKILTTRPARQSAEHLQRVLAEMNNDLSFGGLVLHLTPEKPKMETARKKPVGAVSSEKSLQNFFTTQKNTTNTLSPSLMPKFNEQIKTLFNKETAAAEPPIYSQQPRGETDIKSAHLKTRAARRQTGDETTAWANKLLNLIIILLKYASQLIWLVLVSLFQIIVWLGRNFMLLIVATVNYKKRRAAIFTEWQKQIKFYKNEIFNLPLLTKIIVVAAVVGALLFTSSVLYIRRHQLKLAEEQRNAEILTQINQKKIDIESALIYKDDNGAINILNEALNLVANLACEKNKEQCAAINQELSLLADKAKKISTVKPELLADFTKEQYQLDKIAKVNNLLMVTTPAYPAVIVYDLLTRSFKTIKTGFDAGFTAIAVPKENDYVLFVLNKKDLVKYNPADGAIAKADISYEQENPNVKSLVVYNRRLYSLDASNNQIYKHDNIKTGFGLGKNWIKDSNADIKDGISLTIDGDLFVTKANGEIAKLAGGTKQPFNIVGLYPALNNGGEIWTYTDKTYIYLLDGAQKRLIILEKDGRLKAQVTAAEWIVPKSMTIDENNKTAFILDNNKIYQINLPI